MPSWLGTESGRPLLRWILRHELMHVRHRDHWALLAQTVAGVLFWFHPLLWLARRRWRKYVECACDDAVAETPSGAWHYAVALGTILERLRARTRGPVPAPGLFATRTEIGHRIARLLDRGSHLPRSLGPLGAFCWIVAGAMAVAVGLHLPAIGAAGEPPARSTLKVDLGPDDQRVEPGWKRWSGDRDQNFATDFDRDFEIEIDRDHAWRDRGRIDDANALPFVLRDGLRERDDRDIRLTFKRLDPGDYVLELFSCDVGENKRAAVGRFDVVINGKVVLVDQATMGRVSLAGAALPPIPLTSTGEPIVVALVRREGEIWLNGFAISGSVRRAGD